MAVTGLALESANFVIAQLLTKSGELTTNDIRVLQTGLVETDNGTFSPNGVFGPGTAQSVMKFLAQNDNLHLVTRLSAATKASLAAQGYDTQLQALDQRARSAGHNPASTQGDTIQSLLKQPYPLSQQEMAFLQKQLYDRGHYKLSDDEFVKFADGSAMRVTPNGRLGAQTVQAVAAYVRTNPATLVENPQILGYFRTAGDAQRPFQRQIATGSRAFGEQLNALERVSNPNDMTTTNYRLQGMLFGAGYNGAQPTGELGEETRDALRDYRSQRRASLRDDWTPEGTQVAAVDTDKSINLNLNNDLSGPKPS